MAIRLLANSNCPRILDQTCPISDRSYPHLLFSSPASSRNSILIPSQDYFTCNV